MCRVATGKAVEEPCREAREVEKASRVKCAHGCHVSKFILMIGTM